MIEVIRHGNTSERQMCPKCNCVFIYSKVDIKWLYVSCPECGKEIKVSGMRIEMGDGENE